jgi:hypothetical protein
MPRSHRKLRYLGRLIGISPAGGQALELHVDKRAIPIV